MMWLSECVSHRGQNYTSVGRCLKKILKIAQDCFPHSGLWQPKAKTGPLGANANICKLLTHNRSENRWVPAQRCSLWKLSCRQRPFCSKGGNARVTQRQDVLTGRWRLGPIKRWDSRKSRMSGAARFLKHWTLCEIMLSTTGFAKLQKSTWNTIWFNG